jgi:hypothetical protein
MVCVRCGNAVDGEAKYCDRCGARIVSQPSTEGSPPEAGSPTNEVAAAEVALSSAAPRSFVYAPARRHAWWFPIGVWAIISAFFASVDVATTHMVSWSVWPIGVIGIFLVGVPILHRLERWSLARSAR